MSRRTTTLTAIASAVALLVAFAVWAAWPDLIEPPLDDETAAPATPADVAAGDYLARAGNCVGCHTARGRPAFTGGRAIETPFGDVYSTNLTPDVETGIGAWTAGDFWRALHHGRSKDGRRLYPAFPYPNYTLVSREDSDAIFAYLQSLEPVASPRIEPALRFPYNTEIALVVWRALFFEPREFEPDPERSAAWNRGAYLAEGLGHCGACHSPRGRLGAVDPETEYAGGEIPMVGWDAPPLNAGGPLTDAEAADMARLLATGVSEQTAVTGPMAEVVFHSLQYLRGEDIDAIVEYIRALPAADASPAARLSSFSAPRTQEAMIAGAAVYAEHCADCHGKRGEGEAHKYSALAGSVLVTSASPSNAIRSVMFGGYPPSTAGNPRPYGMPPYSHQLSDAEIAAVLTYIRNSWGNSAPAVTTMEIARH